MNIEELKNTRPAVIDADSLAHIISYNHRDIDDVDMVIDATDDFVHSILQAAQATLYIGLLGAKDTEAQPAINFRHAVAITKPYKGQRKEKPEWYQKWAPIIEGHLSSTWKFIRCQHNMEADDLVASLMHFMSGASSCTPTCCDNDKDLYQIPGHHFDFRKNQAKWVISDVATYNLCYQILIGDSTDNIPGLFKCGPVLAEKILNTEGVEASNMLVTVLHSFMSKLGECKGVESFYENYMLCKLRTDLDVSKYVLTEYDLDGNSIREAKAFIEPDQEDITFDSSLFDAE